MAITKKQIALFHVACQKTGALKEDILAGAGVTSTKDLTQAMFDEIMRHFESLGFKQTGRFYKPKSGNQRLLGKIDAIKKDLDLKDAYIDAMAKQMFGIDFYRWLNGRQLHSLVAALTYHQKRQGRDQVP